MPRERPKNYPKLKNYEPTRFMLPTSHYDEAKADRAVTFIENLKHTKGKWDGKPFWLLPWQEQIIRDIFGVVDENGHRQFRTAYVEIGKKNGKSELAAAVALYLLYADGEPAAEVYGAAADRQQASIVFDVARRMVEKAPALYKRSKVAAATKRIVNYTNAGFYQVLSAEVGTKHGLNVSGLVLDEVHAQPNRKLYDVLTKGSGDARVVNLCLLQIDVSQTHTGLRTGKLSHVGNHLHLGDDLTLLHVLTSLLVNLGDDTRYLRLHVHLVTRFNLTRDNGGLLHLVHGGRKLTVHNFLGL